MSTNHIKELFYSNDPREVLSGLRVAIAAYEQYSTPVAGTKKYGQGSVASQLCAKDPATVRAGLEVAINAYTQAPLDSQLQTTRAFHDILGNGIMSELAAETPAVGA